MTPGLLLAAALLLRPVPAASVQVESPAGAPLVEATRETWARRADDCRKDLARYQARPTVEMVSGLIACTSQPDPRLRALILDKLVNRHLWDAPNFKKDAYPQLRKTAAEFMHDPDYEVAKFAADLDWWLDIWARDVDPDKLAAERRGTVEYILVCALFIGFMVYQQVKYPRSRGVSA
jgi:hypothetical protein